MLLCSSKIPVTTSFSAPIFINLAIEWVLGSRNYSFDSLVWDGKPEFICSGNNGEVFQVGVFENQTIYAVHFISTDNRSIKWTTDFILDTVDNILAFQLYRDAPANIDFVHPAFRSCIHKRLSKVWKWEILTMASADETEISKSLLRRLEWLSQERVRSTTHRQGSFSHW